MRRSFRLEKYILKLFDVFYLPQLSAVYILYTAVIKPEKRGFSCGNDVQYGRLSTILIVLYSDTLF